MKNSPALTVFTALSLSALVLTGCGSNEDTPDNNSSSSTAEAEPTPIDASDWETVTEHEKSPEKPVGLEFIDYNGENRIAQVGMLDLPLIQTFSPDDTMDPLSTTEGTVSATNSHSGLSQNPTTQDVILGSDSNQLTMYKAGENTLEGFNNELSTFPSVGLAHTEDGGIWTSDGDQTISLYEYSPDSVSDSEPIQSFQVEDSNGAPVTGLTELEMSEDGASLYAVQEGTNNLFLIDLETGVAEKRWDLTELADQMKEEGIADDGDSVLSAVASNPEDPSTVWVTGNNWSKFFVLNLD